MFKVLIITFSGIALGYLFRQVKGLQHLQKSISWTIYLLLFFFGLQVGANEQVVGNLDTLGVKALVIAVAGSLGSCVAAWALYRWIFKGGNHLPDSIRCSPGHKNTHLQPTGPQPKSHQSTSQQPTGHQPTSPQSASHQPANPVSAGEENAQADNTEPSGRRNLLSEMITYAAGFVTAGFFAVGCVCGVVGIVPQLVCGGEISMYVLYALMVQVGMSIGCDSRLREMLTSLSPKLFLLPVGTIVGTLMAVAAVGMAVNGLNLTDCMAVGAGFGYYSLSSVLITQIKELEVGAAVAAQIGTIALMSNIIREIITLLFAPAIGKVFGKLAPISVGGTTSMDSTLPVITVACGKEMAFISIFHGVLVDFSVPFLVTFFASL